MSFTSKLPFVASLPIRATNGKSCVLGFALPLRAKKEIETTGSNFVCSLVMFSVSALKLTFANMEISVIQG